MPADTRRATKAELEEIHKVGCCWPLLSLSTLPLPAGMLHSDQRAALSRGSSSSSACCSCSTVAQQEPNAGAVVVASACQHTASCQ